MSDDKHPHSELIPVTKWNQYHVWPTTSALRHLIWEADKNGFNKVIRRVGRAVLLDEEAFYQWVEDQNPSNKKIP